MGRTKQKSKEAVGGPENTKTPSGSPPPATKQRCRKPKAPQGQEDGSGERERTPTCPTRKSPRKQHQTKEVVPRIPRKNSGKGAKNTVPVTATVSHNDSLSETDSEYHPPSSVKSVTDTEASEIVESPVKKAKQSREQAGKGQKGKKDHSQ